MTKRSLYLPTINASVLGDTGQVLRRVDGWFIAMAINYADALKHPRFWSLEGLSQIELDAAMNRAIYQLIRDIEEPTCEEPEHVNVQQVGQSETVGKLGLTIEELEHMVMSSISDIRCNNGTIQVQYHGCCDWTDLCEIKAVANAADGVFNAVGEFAEATTLKLSDFAENAWVWGENPSIPLQQENASEYTGDHLRCLKATAIVNGMLSFMAVLQEAENTTVGKLKWATVVLAAIGAKWLGGQAQVIAEDLFGLYDAWIELDDQIYTDFVADTDLHEEIICALTSQLSYADSITGADFSGLYYTVNAKATELGAALLQVMQHGLVDFIRSDAYQFAELGDCGCPQYLPAGTEPEPGENDFRYTFGGFGQASDPTNICGLPTTFVGELYDFMLDGEFGVPWLDYGKTEFLCNTNGADNSYISMIFHFSRVVTLTDIYLEVWKNIDQATPYCGVWAFDDNTQLWKVGGGASGLNGNAGVHGYDVLSSTIDNVFALVVILKARGNGAHLYVTDVKMTGTYPGQNFVNLKPGIIHEGV